MPFEVLAQPTAAQLPNDIDLVTLAGFKVEAQPNLDSSGGALALDAGTSTVTYTAADGTVMDATAILPEGMAFSQDAGVIFGDDLNTFLIPIFEAVDENQFNARFGLLEATLNDDGALIVSEATLLDTSSDAYASPFDLYPLGDGRVGYVIGGAGDGDNSGETGVFVDTPDAVLQTLLAGFSVEGITHYVALPDGGTLSFREEIFDLGKTFVKQYDSDGMLIESGVVNGPFVDPDFDFGTGVGTPKPTLLIDENGNLEVFYDTELRPDGTIGDDLETYSTSFDLLPIDEVEDTVATEGDDDLTLTDGDDVFDALGGDDIVRGLGGKDWIIGGEGDDSIDGGAGDDALIAGAPVDPVEGEEAGDALPPQGGLYGGAGEDSINGRMGSDWIEGGDGNDDLRGGLGSDSTYTTEDGEVREAGLFGGAGDDFMRGNRGNDDMKGGAGDDDMNGGYGDDNLFGGAGDDKMSGFDGDDLLWAGGGNDTLHGGRGSDDLSGDEGDDVLRGAQGDDFIEGGDGDDVLIGGQGADTFFYYITETSGTDTIKDFTQGQDTFEIISDDELTFDDLFLSQEDSVAVIQAGDTTIRLNGVDADDLTEDDFSFG